MIEDGPPSLQSTIHRIGEEFIADRYAQELEYVPILCEMLHGPKGEGPQQLGELFAGLPFAAEDELPLAAPYVLLTLEATLRELSSRGYSPELPMITEAVRSAAEALGASARLVAELTEDLPPKLATVFSTSDGSLTLDQAGARSKQRPDQLFIERRVAGQSRKPGWAKKKVRTENRRNPRYDIVIDEIARELLIRKNRDATNDEPAVTQFDDLDPRVATMLWYVLKHFGGVIQFGELRRSLNLLASGAQDNAIHKAKSGLMALLGQRISKSLFGRPLRLRYTIRDCGVNYCWMRLTENPLESELLYRAGAPAE